MRTCVCNPAALKAAEELHARSKGYSTSVVMSRSTKFRTYVSFHYKIKRHSAGEHKLRVKRLKMRLVVQGQHMSEVWCCMSMATAIYISPPPGHVEEPDVVYQVLKPLYAAQWVSHSRYFNVRCCYRPMPSSLVPLTSIFRTRTVLHMFNVFRNAQITLRILIICASYPFLLCLCFCSTYVLTLHILFTLTSFWFWHAFCFIRTAIRAAGGFQAIACQKGDCSTRSYSSIFHRFYFSGYFYFRRVVRNDSLVRRLRRQRSRPCAVGR